MISVVFGSKKSKKTAFAEDLLNGYLGSKYFIASMRPLGDSDKEKVERFRKQREGKGFVTIEQDVAIVKAIDKIKWMESLLGTNDSENAGKKAALIANIPAICAHKIIKYTRNCSPFLFIEIGIWISKNLICGIAIVKYILKTISYSQ